MDWQNEKCVMVIDENLPLGIIANTAAIMGITLGKKMPEVVGADVTDQSGNEHLGVIEFPVPILWGSPEIIKQIRMVLLRETTAEWSINRVNGQGPTEPCPLTFLRGIITTSLRRPKPGTV